MFYGVGTAKTFHSTNLQCHTSDFLSFANRDHIIGTGILSM